MFVLYNPFISGRQIALIKLISMRLIVAPQGSFACFLIMGLIWMRDMESIACE